MPKTIEDLNISELLDNLEYHLLIAYLQAPSFMDKIIEILVNYTKELRVKTNAME